MMSTNAAALRMQNDRCMISKHRESYREQTLHMLSNHSRGTLMSYADHLRGAALSQTLLYISPSVGFRKR